jgi:hypothetical protein
MTRKKNRMKSNKNISYQVANGKEHLQTDKDMVCWWLIDGWRVEVEEKT